MDPLDVKMRVFGYSAPRVLRDLPTPEWVEKGSEIGTSRYFEVLLSLLKRFISLLRARAKVYSRYLPHLPRAKSTPRGSIWTPPDPSQTGVAMDLGSGGGSKGSWEVRWGLLFRARARTEVRGSCPSNRPDSGNRSASSPPGLTSSSGGAYLERPEGATN